MWQYKLIHRCYATNSIISKWDNSKSAICDICNKKANIVHNFFSCDDVKQFWSAIENWYASIYKTPTLIFSLKDIIFVKCIGAKLDCLNHMLLYAKYFIHRQSVKKKSLKFEHFAYYYQQVLEMEKQRYTIKNQLLIFTKRFSKCELVKNVV
jgi:hypothetical protein